MKIMPKEKDEYVCNVNIMSIKEGFEKKNFFAFLMIIRSCQCLRYVRLLLRNVIKEAEGIKKEKI